MNIFEMEAELEYGVGKHYDSLSKSIPDYEAKYKEILKARKEEFKRAPRFLWIGPRLYSEKDYPYFDKLAAEQKYYINNGEVGIRTEEFSLPVTQATKIEKVEIYSSAIIPCGCWEAVRKKIAEESDLMVGDNELYANVDSISKITSKILCVKDAKKKLEMGIQKDFNNRLELTKI